VIKKLLCIGLLSCSAVSLEPVVAVGDTPDASTTFQFSVGSGIYDATTERLWTLSGSDTSSLTEHVQSYGIAYTPFISVDSQSKQILTAYPYLPNQAIITTTFDGQLILPDTSISNPLLGQSFDTVTFLGTYLTTVASATPSHVYLIQSTKFYDNQLGTSSPDGYSIMNLLDLGENQAKEIAGSLQGVLFIASAQGTFGTDSSQISFASTFVTNANVAGQVTSCTAMIEQAGLPVDLDTAVLTAHGNNLSSIGSSIALYPSPVKSLQMYVGLDVTAGVDGQAVGLFTAQANQASGEVPASMTFHAILPDLVASSDVQTPISAPALERVAVADVTTVITSTGLSYLVTSRYDQTEEQSIYAMPMVTMADNADDNGKVANFDSIAQQFKIIGVTYRVQGFDEVITDPEQINIQGTTPVVKRLQVGAGSVPLAAGQFIEQLVAQGDAVYITIQDPFAPGSTPGMFKSQALFDAQGRIQSWTPWQRVAGTDDQMLFAIKNRLTDATMYVSGASSDTIQQTTWNNSDELAAFITKAQANLQKQNGGIQAIIPFPTTTEGFTALPDSKVSMLAATGNGAVVLAQTGHLVDETFQILTQTDETSIVLDSSLGLTIGSVVTAAFGSDFAGNNWLFMAGEGGLAVLSKPNGSGFATLPNDAAAAYLISEDQTCKTLGSFTFVKKIVNDGTYIYVMTQDAVYRFIAMPEKFRAEDPIDLEVVQVVTAGSLAAHAYCTDMLVTRDIIFLGTTAGLYSINAQEGIPGVVTPIAIPGGLSTVSCLQIISDNTFGFLPDTYRISNMYVLTIDYSLQQARLNRFAIENEVATPIQDQLLEGQNGPLLIFDYMSNTIFMDGSLGFATSYRIRSIPPAVKYLQYTLQAGKSSTQISLKASTSNLSIVAVINSLGIAAITREYASGALILGADFGLLADS
jgi:hypothetical protein